MSKYVLTDVLLDFGRSLWKDASLREQWRGLASGGFEPVGKFGIGFFAVFMLGDEIKVTTWRYGSNINDQITLHLRNRVVDRPILLQAEEAERLSEPGTRVSVKLRDGRKSLAKQTHQTWTLPFKMNAAEFRLDKLITHLAPTLDIDVWCQDCDAPPTRPIQANDWEALDAFALLCRLKVNMTEDALKRYASRLRVMRDNTGRAVGRAALIFDRARRWSLANGAGVLVHRGLQVGNCDGIIGFILAENSFDLARKTAVPILDEPTLRRWAKEQLLLNPEHEPTLTEKIVSLDCGEKASVVGKIDGEAVTILGLIPESVFCPSKKPVRH